MKSGFYVGAGCLNNRYLNCSICINREDDFDGCKFYQRKMIYDGLERQYQYIVPERMSEKLPIIAMFLHGATGNCCDFCSALNYKGTIARMLEKKNMIAVFPEGTGRFLLETGRKDEARKCWWNAAHGCNWAFERDIDDLGFLSEVSKSVAWEQNLSDWSSCVAGFSNGGMMAYKFASLSSAEVNLAAMADVSGSIGGYERANCIDGEPLISDPRRFGAPGFSFFLVHGKKDMEVPIEGGNAKEACHRWDLPFSEAVKILTEHNNLRRIGTEKGTYYAKNDNGQVMPYYYNESLYWENDACIYKIFGKVRVVPSGEHAWLGGAELTKDIMDFFEMAVMMKSCDSEKINELKIMNVSCREERSGNKY